jgi:hypothetical protein
MRRVLFFSLVATIVFAVALGAALTSSEATQQGPEFRQVNIRVTCTDDEVDEVNIRPWTVRASREAGQQLRWRLVGTGITSATIQPKTTSQWPFDSVPPLNVGRGNGTDSGPITVGAGTYYYDIIVNCGSGETVIDPRMDIRP